MGEPIPYAKPLPLPPPPRQSAVRPPFSTDIVSRLRGRYGWSGGAYRQLIGQIIATNNERVARNVARVRVAKLHQQAAGLTSRWKRVVLPSVEEAVPKRALFLRKGAERGKILTDELRASLSKDLREAMAEMRRSGMQLMITQTGTTRGRLNPRLVDVFEQKIVKRFASYAKRDPEVGVPRNVRTIAVTETRATISGVKGVYMQRLADKNPGLEIRKRWKHNPHLSKEPRPGHREMDGVEVGMDEPFEVPEWMRVGGKWHRTNRVWRLKHPHDPTAPPQEVVSCQCDVDFVARRSVRVIASPT